MKTNPANRVLSPEDFIGMVLKVLSCWPVRDELRLANWLTVEAIVLLTVGKFFFDSLAHYNLAVCWVHSDISSIEKAMEITAHQKSIGYFVALVQVKRSDMSSVEHRQSALPS
jgi:hypothetical protein